MKLDSPKRAGVFISGEQLVNAMETMMSSDEMMRERVTQGKGFKEPPSNMETFNEMIFGEKGPVKFTISGEGRPQFDYEQEVRQAKEETKQLTSKLGIESGVSNAGETERTDAGEHERTDDDESETTAGSGADTGGKAGTFGVARENEKTMKASWGIAFLNEQENELILGFYPKTPEEHLRNKIKEKRGLFGVTQLKKPFIEVTFGLYQGASLSEQSAKKYSMLFHNFSKGPMTLNRSPAMMDEVQLKLDGSLKKGGRIKGSFKGSQDFKFQDRDDTYSWDLTFELPIQ